MSTTYKKPTGLKYTTMAIFIDNNIYRPDLDEETQNTIYQYMYHIIYVLACKKRYFQRFEDYDSFAIFGATRIYLRMTNRKQFAVNPGEKMLPKVKSVLNYIKNALYGMKVDWQKENFAEVINPALNNINTDILKLNIENSIQSDYMSGLAEAIFDDFQLVPEMARKIVNKTPYKKNKLLCKNLYMSILLTFINSVTLSNVNIERIERNKNKNKNFEELLVKLYRAEQENAVILWHLDESMHDYVQVLYNKLKYKLSNSLMDTQNSFKLTDDVMQAIIASSYGVADEREVDGDA